MNEESKEKLRNLYKAANEMLAGAVFEGYMPAEHALSDQLMTALREIDGGEYNEKAFDKFLHDSLVR